MTKAETIGDAADVEEFYRIGELAEEFDVTLRALRFYEDKGLIGPRRLGNTRLYSRRDRARLRLILLGKRVGLSLHDIRELFALYDPASGNRRQLESADAKGAEQLDRLRQERASIDEAIAELERTLADIRARLSALADTRPSPHVPPGSP